MRWAREHLVYEASMLLHAVEKVATNSLSDQDHNAFIESFAVHVRCLRDFLWGKRGTWPEDAFASDFCAPGAWEQARPEEPEVLKEIYGRDRIGREIVHLTYHRLDIAAETKDWNMGGVLQVIAEALSLLSEKADLNRLDEKTRKFLASMPRGVPIDARVLATDFRGVTGASQAVGEFQLRPPKHVSGGTIPADGYTAEDAIPPDSSP
jgi:hypothetical protein